MLMLILLICCIYYNKLKRINQKGVLLNKSEEKSLRCSHIYRKHTQNPAMPPTVFL